MRIVGGLYKNRSIFAPHSAEVRPTLARTRAMVFNICQHEIDGASFLDLFAGTGAMGIEAISRGASRAVFIDHHRPAIAAIKKTVDQLSIENQVDIRCQDVIEGLEALIRHQRKFDIVYLDPPYFKAEESKRFELVERALFLLDTSDLLKPGGLVFVEDSKKSPIEKCGFSTLTVKSKRPCGDAYLWQFCHREKNEHKKTGLQ